jgi:hypothetical protein
MHLTLQKPKPVYNKSKFVSVTSSNNVKITCGGSSKWDRNRDRKNFNRKVEEDIQRLLRKKSIYDKMRFQETSDVILRGVASDISKLSEIVKELRENAEELQEYINNIYDYNENDEDNDNFNFNLKRENENKDEDEDENENENFLQKK